MFFERFMGGWFLWMGMMVYFPILELALIFVNGSVYLIIVKYCFGRI